MDNLSQINRYRDLITWGYGADYYENVAVQIDGCQPCIVVYGDYRSGNHLWAYLTDPDDTTAIINISLANADVSLPTGCFDATADGGWVHSTETPGMTAILDWVEYIGDHDLTPLDRFDPAMDTDYEDVMGVRFDGGTVTNEDGYVNSSYTTWAEYVQIAIKLGAVPVGYRMVGDRHLSKWGYIKCTIPNNLGVQADLYIPLLDWGYKLIGTYQR